MLTQRVWNNALFAVSLVERRTPFRPNRRTIPPSFIKNDRRETTTSPSGTQAQPGKETHGRRSWASPLKQRFIPWQEFQLRNLGALRARPRNACIIYS
jgi:hypothetical protein